MTPFYPEPWAKNPTISRDTVEDTSTNRGMDLTDCRQMLFEAGFTKLAKGDGTLVDLDEAYIQAHIH